MKVAIITFSDCRNYYEDYSRIVNDITDWVEITEEEYKLLCRQIDSSRYVVVCQPKDQYKFIKLTVAKAIEIAKQREEEEKERKKEAEEKKRQRELKKKAKTEAEEKALLEALLLKHGPKA